LKDKRGSALILLCMGVLNGGDPLAFVPGAVFAALTAVQT
jgi:hypothetical protein